jgi:hypothetical protein
VVAESTPLDVEPVCSDMTEHSLDAAKGVLCTALVGPGSRTGTETSVEGTRPPGKGRGSGASSQAVGKGDSPGMTKNIQKLVTKMDQMQAKFQLGVSTRVVVCAAVAELPGLSLIAAVV